MGYLFFFLSPAVTEAHVLECCLFAKYLADLELAFRGDTYQKNCDRVTRRLRARSAASLDAALVLRC